MFFVIVFVALFAARAAQELMPRVRELSAV